MTRLVFFGQSLSIFDWLLLRSEIDLVCVYVSRLSDEIRSKWLTRSLIREIRLIEVGEHALSIDQLEQTLPDALDLGLCAHFELIPERVIQRFRLGIINIHPAPLPRFPGRYPLVELCLSDETKAGVSLHWISERYFLDDIMWTSWYVFQIC